MGASLLTPYDNSTATSCGKLVEPKVYHISGCHWRRLSRFGLDRRFFVTHSAKGIYKEAQTPTLAFRRVETQLYKLWDLHI